MVSFALICFAPVVAGNKLTCVVASCLHSPEPAVFVCGVEQRWGLLKILNTERKCVDDTRANMEVEESRVSCL
jgi:hypothetical protein